MQRLLPVIQQPGEKATVQGSGLLGAMTQPSRGERYIIRGSCVWNRCRKMSLDLITAVQAGSVRMGVLLQDRLLGLCMLLAFHPAKLHLPSVRLRHAKL